MIWTILLFLITTGIAAGALYQVMNITKEFKALQDKHQHAERSIRILENEIKALLSADIAFGEGITSLKNQLFALSNRQSALETKRDNDGSYEHALKILQMGGTIEEVKQSCHLSPAEAELLMNLHAYRTISTS